MKRLEQSTEDEVESTFSSIVGQKKKNQEGLKRKITEDIENQTASKAKKTKKSKDFRDDEFYIPYTKDNVFADEGWDSRAIWSYSSPVESAYHRS